MERAAFFLRETPFQRYGPSHTWVLAIFALLAVAAVLIGRRQRQGSSARRTCASVGALLLVVQLALQVYSMLPQHWDVGSSLPFQLCDLAWMLAVYALWTQRPWACGLLYYWGLTLTSQALVTPVLDFDFPHVQFLMFWFSHVLVVLATIYLTWGLGHRPRWSHYGLALAVTFGWGVIMLGFNACFKTNYLYVSAKPPGTLLDRLGEWPFYLLSEIAIVTIVWALMTWPWARRRTRRRGEFGGHSVTST